MTKHIFVLLFIVSMGYRVFAQEDSTKTKFTSFSIYPALGSSPETGFVFGAIAFLVLKNKSEVNDEFYRPTSITPFAVYSVKNQFLSKVDVDIFLKNGININGNFRYVNFPDKFFGIGNGNDPGESEEFTNQFVRINGRLIKSRTKNLFLGLTYDLQLNTINVGDNDGKLIRDNVVGVAGGRTIGFGPSVLWDTRNSTLYPTSGNFLNLGITTYSKIFGSEYGFTSYIIDYRTFFELLGPKNIFAFQFRAQLNSSKDVPFYKLSRLGGSERLRGVEHKNLITSRQTVFAQVEARQELFWRFGGVIYAGMGEAFDAFSDFNTSNMRFIYGLGGRFQALKDEKLNIRLDLGFTDNGQSAFYFSIREAF